MDGPLERISKCCGRTRRNVTWPQNGLAVSQNKTTRTLIRGYLPAYGPSTACDSQFRNPLYRVPEIVTRGRFPDGGESDSTWRTQEAGHVGSDTIAPGF